MTPTTTNPFDVTTRFARLRRPHDRRGLWRRPVSPGFAALTIAVAWWRRPVSRGFAALTIGVAWWRRPVSPGFAALTIAAGA
ncbi:hypothetical protein [Mycobacterium sp. E2989]|uniref:hypothetical protein n=1 Tax=Mycobacterium sp. E2989 TaxID=1834140 RepID=UPI0012E77CDC|nr:hypothetical protein [Mycobacterium sp. E2989]